MHEKLVGILEKLGIDIAFMEYNDNSKEYIIFKIYNDIDSNFSDDINKSNTNYIEINYWFKDLKNIKKYKKIKKIMKENGFIFDGGKDLKDDSYYGKNMDFIYVDYEMDGE